jgi:hypothetical protein
MNIKKTFWKLIDSEGKHLQTYNHPVKAEHAADCYFKATGVMPTIIVIKKA